MPTLHAHSYELFLIARKASKEAFLDAKRPNALTTDSIVAVVMAAAATEAFLNELAHHEDFALLIDLRNEIVHAKPAADDTHRGTRIATALERRGIAQRLFPGVSTAWLHVVESPGVGKWACESALAIIRAVLDLCPGHECSDPLRLLRQFNRPFLDQLEPLDPPSS